MPNQKQQSNWEKEFNEICFYEEEASVFETPTPENPPIIKRLNADHLGDIQYKLLPKLKSFIFAQIERAYKNGYNAARNKREKLDK